MKHVYIIPDCPECGKELSRRMRFEGPTTDENPYGTYPVRWWQCDHCGWQSDTVPSEDFERLTKSLVSDGLEGGEA